VSVLSAQALLGLVLFDLTIIMVLARSVGTLFTRFGQPRVVGEIVAGVLLGPTLLGPAL
jgi:Kef-type K+ transport system membrane component KefB